jgi:hypothetical protein
VVVRRTYSVNFTQRGSTEISGLYRCIASGSGSRSKRTHLRVWGATSERDLYSSPVGSYEGARRLQKIS